MSDIENQAKNHYSRIMGRFGERAKSLGREAAEELLWASRAFAQLTAEVAEGKISADSVKESFDDIESIIADWSYIGFEDAHAAFWETANEAAGVAGSMLGNLVSTAIKKTTGLS